MHEYPRGRLGERVGAHTGRWEHLYLPSYDDWTIAVLDVDTATGKLSQADGKRLGSLKRLRLRALRPRLAVTAVDASGNTGVVRTRVKLKR